MLSDNKKTFCSDLYQCVISVIACGAETLSLAKPLERKKRNATRGTEKLILAISVMIKETSYGEKNIVQY